MLWAGCLRGTSVGSVLVPRSAICSALYRKAFSTTWLDTTDETEAFPSMISPITKQEKPRMPKQRMQSFRQFGTFSLLFGKPYLCMKSMLLEASRPEIMRAVAFFMLVVTALANRRAGTTVSGPIVSGPLDNPFTGRLRTGLCMHNCWGPAALVVPMFERGITSHGKGIDSFKRTRSRIVRSALPRDHLRVQRGADVENMITGREESPPFGMDLASSGRFVERGSHGPLFAPRRGGERNFAGREPWFFPRGAQLLNSCRERPGMSPFAQDTSALSIDPGRLGVDVELL